MNSRDDDSVTTGNWGSVRYARLPDGSMPSKEFYNERPLADKAKLMALFSRLSSFGEIKNKEKFTKERGRIFAVKSFQIRVGCFQKGRTWYLTHGFIKKQDKWPSAELDRAETIFRNHIN